jgi:hypothetical protein
MLGARFAIQGYGVGTIVGVEGDVRKTAASR